MYTVHERYLEFIYLFSFQAICSTRCTFYGEQSKYNEFGKQEFEKGIPNGICTNRMEDKKKEIVLLRSQLDLLGGQTGDAIRNNFTYMGIM